jgi:hypothetical protein
MQRHDSTAEDPKIRFDPAVERCYKPDTYVRPNLHVADQIRVHLLGALKSNPSRWGERVNVASVGRICLRCCGDDGVSRGSAHRIPVCSMATRRITWDIISSSNTRIHALVHTQERDKIYVSGLLQQGHSGCERHSVRMRKSRAAASDLQGRSSAKYKHCQRGRRRREKEDIDENRSRLRVLHVLL